MIQTTKKSIKTLQLRVKDKHASVLLHMSREVNTVFNFCNETSIRAIRDRNHWISGYELQKLTAGYSKCDGVKIGASSINVVCTEYATRRRQFKKNRLRWRVSNRKSSKYSLGWVPFKAEQVKYRAGQITFGGIKFSLWDSFGLANVSLRAGNFSEDSRGRWYFNVAVEVDCQQSSGTSAVGVDLGLKAAATCSDGRSFVGRLYRESESRLIRAQRANKKRQVKTIHAKIRNQRRDGLHKFSTNLVKENAAIFIGDVSSAKMAKTTMAKSAHDAGWSMLKAMLEYKSLQAGVVFQEINESWSTQICNICGVIAGPKGRAELNKRVWQCKCRAVHDRDVNAALNIRARGLARLAEGAST